MGDQWEEHQSLLRCFTLPIEGRRVTFGAEARGKSVEGNVEDLRLFLSIANGIGILSVGIEASDISAAQAPWINEMMRKGLSLERTSAARGTHAATHVAFARRPACGRGGRARPAELKDFEHFALQYREFRIAPMMAEIAEEIESRNVSLNEYYQRRNMDAVNRLGLLSMIFGAGAVATGFFGMNFARSFGSAFFEPETSTAAHWAAIIGVSIVAVISLLFGVYLLARSLGRLPPDRPAQPQGATCEPSRVRLSIATT